MPDTPSILYWDSCAFLSYVNETPGCVPTLEAFLEKSATGEVQIYTSAISHVEVAFAASEQQRGRLNSEIERRIDSLWSDPKVVASVEYQDLIGQIARDMIREGISRSWSVKPLDAIHLATAQWLSSVGIGVDEFHTYDHRLFRYVSVVEFDVREPRTPQPRMI